MQQSLSPTSHTEVLSILQKFAQGSDDSKNVGFRDRLDEIFTESQVLMGWRLMPHQVGILNTNRDGEGIAAVGVVIRGRRIFSSGFSLLAAGRLWAFEDGPKSEFAEFTM